MNVMNYYGLQTQTVPKNGNLYTTYQVIDNVTQVVMATCEQRVHAVFIVKLLNNHANSRS